MPFLLSLVLLASCAPGVQMLHPQCGHAAADTLIVSDYQTRAGDLQAVPTAIKWQDGIHQLPQEGWQRQRRCIAIHLCPFSKPVGRLCKPGASKHKRFMLPDTQGVPWRCRRCISLQLPWRAPERPTKAGTASAEMPRGTLRCMLLHPVAHAPLPCVQPCRASSIHTTCNGTQRLCESHDASRVCGNAALCYCYNVQVAQRICACRDVTAKHPDAIALPRNICTALHASRTCTSSSHKHSKRVPFCDRRLQKSPTDSTWPAATDF
jgi:hypothetical protein